MRDPQDLQLVADVAGERVHPHDALLALLQLCWYANAESAIAVMNQPSSMPRSKPDVIVPSDPRSRICAKMRSASASMRSVSASTYQEPPSGSTTLSTPVSSAITCWVRSAICAAFS